MEIFMDWHFPFQSCTDGAGIGVKNADVMQENSFLTGKKTNLGKLRMV